MAVHIGLRTLAAFVLLLIVFSLAVYWIIKARVRNKKESIVRERKETLFRKRKEALIRKKKERA
jgi:hypothetical protein